MEPWSIVKIVLMVVGAMVALDHTPGVSIFKDSNEDYKSLVKCEAKREGLERKHRHTLAELEQSKKDLKNERKKSNKLEKMLEQEVKGSFSGRGGDNHRRAGLRGRDGSGARENLSRKIFPWRWQRE